MSVRNPRRGPAIAMWWAVALAACACPAFGQQVIYVDADAAQGGNGQSWATAFRDLQDALDAAAIATPAQPIVEIWVAEGEYIPTEAGWGGPTDRSFLVAGSNSIAIVGGFEGTETSSLDRPMPFPATVLSGDFLQNDDQGICGSDPCWLDNSRALLWTQSAGPSSSLILEDLHLTDVTEGAFLVGSPPGVNLRGCDIGPSHHAALFESVSRVTVSRCRIHENDCDDPSRDCSPLIDTAKVFQFCVLEGCRVFSNDRPFPPPFIVAESGLFGSAGGVADLRLINCSVYNNTVAAPLVLLTESSSNVLGSSSVDNCLFTANTMVAPWTGNYDPGVVTIRPYTAACDPDAARASGDVRNSLIAENTGFPGGTIACGDCHSTIAYCVLDGGASVSVPPTGSGPTTVQLLVYLENPTFLDRDGADNVMGTADDDFRPLPASQLVDTGSTSASIEAEYGVDLDGDFRWIEPLSLDADRNPRPVDGPNAPDVGEGAGAITDIGPFEAPSCMSCSGARFWQPFGSQIGFTSFAAKFSSGSSWNPGVPGPLNTAVFQASAGYNFVDFDGAVQNLELRIGSAAGTFPVFDLAAASYELLSTTTTPVIIAQDAGDIAGLTILNGPMISERGIVAQGVGSYAELRITGLGGEWFVDQELRVGDGGQAVVTIDSGGLLDVLDLTLGGLSGARGDLIVDGVGSIARSLFGVEIVNGSIELRNGGVLELGFPGFQAELSVRAGASVVGVGEISGANVLNLGVVQPGAAPIPGGGVQPTLTVDGNFVQFADLPRRPDEAGSLRVRATGAAGAPDVGILTVNGAATLGGGLVVTGSFTGGAALTPTAAQNLAVLDATAITGRFDVALLPPLDGGSQFLSLDYGGLQRAGVAVSLQVNTLTGTVNLDPASTEDTGQPGVPTDAVLADIDGDGDPDLLVTLPDASNPTTAPGSIVVLYNADDGNAGNGWEGFTGGTRVVTTGVGVNPSAIDVGAIDADGNVDIVVANRGTPGNGANDSVTVVLLANGTQAGFTVSDTRVIAVEDEPRDVAIGDADGDGIPDILVANSMSDSISIAFGSGTGAGPGWIGIGEVKTIDLPEEDEIPVSIRPGDTNAGLTRMVATANSASGTSTVYRTNANRTFTLVGSIPVGAEPVQVILANLDNDATNPNDAPELITVNRGGNSVSIARNTTVGSTVSFAPAVELPIGVLSTPPSSIAVGDFDADTTGDPDLAILADGVIKVLRNDLLDGELVFTPIPDEPAGVSPLIVVSADVNLDGRDDVVTVAESNGALVRASGRSGPDAVAILLGAPTPPDPICTGDINLSGSTTASDFVILAGAFGSSVAPNTSGDLNGDGLVNAADFVILAGDFGCQITGARETSAPARSAGGHPALPRPGSTPVAAPHRR